MDIAQVLTVLERWGILGFASIILVFAGWLIKYTLDQNARRESDHTQFISGEMSKLRDAILNHDKWEQVAFSDIREALRRSRDEHDRIHAAILVGELPMPKEKVK